jgi:hypothetical protein
MRKNKMVRRLAVGLLLCAAAMSPAAVQRMAAADADVRSLATEVKNDRGEVIGWRCAGGCMKGGKCCARISAM